MDIESIIAIIIAVATIIGVIIIAIILPILILLFIVPRLTKYPHNNMLKPVKYDWYSQTTGRVIGYYDLNGGWYPKVEYIVSGKKYYGAGNHRPHLMISDTTADGAIVTKSVIRPIGSVLDVYYDPKNPSDFYVEDDIYTPARME